MLRIEEISDKAFTEPLSIDSALLEPSNNKCYGSRGFKAGITGAIAANATALQVREFHFSEIQRSGIIKKNIHEIDFGDYHDNLQNDIISSVKRIHAASQKNHDFTRQELATRLANNIRGKVNMLVRGGLLRPALSPAVSFVVSKAVNHFQNLHNERVEAIKHGPSGVAAGDVNPEYEREMSEARKAGSPQPEPPEPPKPPIKEPDQKDKKPVQEPPKEQRPRFAMRSREEVLASSEPISHLTL